MCTAGTNQARGPNQKIMQNEIIFDNFSTIQASFQLYLAKHGDK